MTLGFRRRVVGPPRATRRSARVARAGCAALIALTLLAACRSGTATPTSPPRATAASPTIAAGTPGVVASPTRAVATPATPPPATPIAIETTVQVIAPFKDGALVLNYNRNESVVGTCIGPSLTSPARADAWRCLANGTTQPRDPCFALGDEAQPPLICFRQPWNGGVTLFVLSAPLPGGGRPPPIRPPQTPGGSS